MHPKGLYRCYVLTVQSTQGGNIFSSRRARSACGEIQQLLKNMCCNIRAQFGAKSEDAKCIQMRAEEVNSGRQRQLSAEVALNKDPNISLLPHLLSLPGKPQVIAIAKQYHGISMLKNHFASRSPFALVRRCTVHPATSKYKTNLRNCTSKCL